LPATAFAANFDYNDRRRYFIARDYVENVLATVEPGGMVLTMDWQVYSPTFYLQEVEALRPDAVVIDVNQLRRSWYFDYLEHRYPETMNRARQQVDEFLEDLRQWDRDPELYQRDAAASQRISTRFQELILTFVGTHLESHPVYVTHDIATYRGGPDSDWTQQIVKKYQLVPQGMVFQLYSDRDFHQPADPALVTRGLNDGSLRFADNDVVRLKVLPVYSQMLFNRGRYFAAFNRHAEAIEAYKQALAIDPRFSAAERGIAESDSALKKAGMK
jgi:tetratricopeptide (TPR) repeat protein